MVVLIIVIAVLIISLIMWKKGFINGDQNYGNKFNKKYPIVGTWEAYNDGLINYFKITDSYGCDIIDTKYSSGDSTTTELNCEVNKYYKYYLKEFSQELSFFCWIKFKIVFFRQNKNSRWLDEKKTSYFYIF